MRISNFQNYEYPKNYFNCFAFINKYVREKISDLNFKEDYRIAINILLQPDSLPLYYNIIDIEKVKEVTKELPIKNRLIRFNEIDENKNSYILAILATYGNDKGKPKKISDFISGLLSNKFSPKRVEKLCLIFGINQGYSTFRNQYKIQDKIIKTKFELNSELDYTIIESIYQYVFNGIKENTTFEYINNWCPIYEKKQNFDEYETYEILDKEIAYKKKAILGSEEYIQKLFQLFLENNEISELFKLLKEDISNVFKEKLKLVYERIRLDIEHKHKKELEKLEKQYKNDIKINSSEASLEKPDDFNKTIDNDTLKIVAKDIKTIGDLQTIAKYIGIDANKYTKYKKAEIEQLRDLIVNYKSLV
jgi:hypothetical protein